MNCRDRKISALRIANFLITIIILFAFDCNISSGKESKQAFYKRQIGNNLNGKILNSNMISSGNNKQHLYTSDMIMKIQRVSGSIYKRISPQLQTIESPDTLNKGNNTLNKSKNKSLNSKSSIDTLLTDKNWYAKWAKIPALKRIAMEKNFGRLIVIDGEIASDNQIKRLKTTDIKSLKIKDDQETERIYGDAGKNGILLVITNKAN